MRKSGAGEERVGVSAYGRGGSEALVGRGSRKTERHYQGFRSVEAEYGY